MLGGGNVILLSAASVCSSATLGAGPVGLQLGIGISAGSFV